MRSGLTIVTWAACAWLALAGIAQADRLDALLRAAHDPSWRVRLQAASVLAKLKSADAVPIVEQLLDDENDNVRGVAAAALGELARAPNVDHARLRMDLERMDADRSSIVREHARHALKELAAVEAKQHKASEPAATGTLHVAIGGVGAKQKNVPPELTRRLRELLIREFSHTPGMTLDGTPVSGFLIDSSITALTRHTTREWVEINCEVSVIVGRLPSKAMVMMTSGGATVQQPKGAVSSASTAMLEADALEGAVKGAHENLLAYLRARR
jgi:hypothetical protein